MKEIKRRNPVEGKYKRKESHIGFFQLFVAILHPFTDVIFIGQQPNG
ncbi:MAG: hypothetical protein ACTHKA_01260 [Anaerocolumna jejuensis]